MFKNGPYLADTPERLKSYSLTGENWQMDLKYKNLSPATKVAIFMLTIGEDLAAKILAELPKPEAKKVIFALKSLSHVEPEMVDAVLQEVSSLLEQMPGQAMLGGLNHPQNQQKMFAKLLTLLDKDQVNLFANFKPFPTLEILAEFDDEWLAAYLSKQHPQTMAVLAAHLPGPRFAKVVKQMAEVDLSSLLVRIAYLEPVEVSFMEEIEDALRTELEQHKLKPRHKIGGVEAVAKLLGTMNQEAAKTYLTYIAEKDPNLAGAVREHMFRFEDLLRIAATQLVPLVQSIPTNTWVLALKVSSKPVRDHIYKAMSERSAKRLQEDLETLPKVKVSDCEQAQRAIADAARQMIDDGNMIMDDQLSDAPSTKSTKSRAS